MKSVLVLKRSVTKTYNLKGTTTENNSRVLSNPAVFSWPETLLVNSASSFDRHLSRVKET